MLTCSRCQKVLVEAYTSGLLPELQFCCADCRLIRVQSGYISDLEHQLDLTRKYHGELVSKLRSIFQSENCILPGYGRSGDCLGDLAIRLAKDYLSFKKYIYGAKT